MPRMRVPTGSRPQLRFSISRPGPTREGRLGALSRTGDPAQHSLPPRSRDEGLPSWDGGQEPASSQHSVAEVRRSIMPRMRVPTGLRPSEISVSRPGPHKGPTEGAIPNSAARPGTPCLPRSRDEGLPSWDGGQEPASSQHSVAEVRRSNNATDEADRLASPVRSAFPRPGPHRALGSALSPTPATRPQTLLGRAEEG